MEQARTAREAFRRYGKGAHPAGLNFGDCFAYALAKTTGKRLLFKGNDFSQTISCPPDLTFVDLEFAALSQALEVLAMAEKG